MASCYEIRDMKYDKEIWLGSDYEYWKGCEYEYLSDLLSEAAYY